MCRLQSEIQRPESPTPFASRVEAALRRSGPKHANNLVVYLAAGDPTLEDTGKLLSAVDRGGADLIELGVPFSDPMADGPVIQRASERALKAGTTLRRIFERLGPWRQAVRAPIILFSYYNPILQYGFEQFSGDLAHAGAEGALVVDLSPEEAEPYTRVMRAASLDTVFLASPTSTDERITRIARISTGFVYLISRPGVTGERANLSAAVPPLVNRVRQFTNLPLAVGFGLSTPAQVAEIQRFADAAVVGSALVRAIEERYPAEGESGIERFVRWLKSSGSTPE
jgi:tryptophan synthase alpha chain